MSIIISKNGRDAQKIDKTGFDKEDYLQQYIQDNPESIPIYELEEDKKLLVVKREFPTNAGPIDALAVDKEGNIYIVETKLYKNPDKRTVVAQSLDYGAALWKHQNDFQKFINILNDETQKRFSMSFENKVKDFFNLLDEEFELMMESLKKSLDEGIIKFVILMDSVDERLKDLILYVNQNSQFDIYAVQLDYYKFEDYEIMIPKMFGIEVKKSINIASTSERRIWNEQDFINQTNELLKDDASKVIQLYEYFKEKADKINWGTSKNKGSFAPIFNKISKGTSPFSIYSNGNILIKFRWLTGYYMSKEDTEKHYKEFIDELHKNTNIEAPDDYLDKDFTISGQDFLNNYDGVVEAIKKVIANN